jgi:gas vesicle protein
VEDKKMKAITFLEGFILGAMLGAVAAMLMAPASGEELRGQIQTEAQRIRSDVNQAASERRAELEKQLANLRSPRSTKPESK